MNCEAYRQYFSKDCTFFDSEKNPVEINECLGCYIDNYCKYIAKMFEINFEDQNSEKKQVWQTSWGLSTRSIGAMIMVHSDDTGLVLPPKVAHTQVVIIPIIKKGDDAAAIKAAAEKAYSSLKAAGVRVDLDDRDNYNPGFKYNHWELRGTPIRLELGKKDFDNQEVRCCKRHDGVKSQIKQDTLAEEIPKLLEVIHKEMYDKAL